MTVALYARVSTPRQSHTQTIEQQLERLHARIEECAREQPRREECLVFRDDGYSGTTLRRPGLDALRDAVASARVERVLITAPDRLARKYVHQVLLLEELERFGCVVEFLDRPMSRDPHDQLLLQIRGAVAEYERTLIAERMRRGRLAKLRTGTLLPWTRVPYGYRVDPDRPRDPLGVRSDPAEGAVVQQLFVRYLQPGATLEGVVAALAREGIPTPHGRTQWSRSTLRWMLSNPVYRGQVYANRTHARPAHQRHSALQPVGQQGTTLELTARETWLLVTTIPPLVSPEVFDQAQVKLAENRRLARRHNTTGDYLLRALVSCGVCGYACKGRQEPPRYAYYLCAGKVPGRPEHPEGRCPARYIPAQALDDLVWQDLCDVLTHPDSLAQALERAQAGAWLPQDLQARRAQLQQGIQHVERQVERVGDAYQAGAMPLAEYRRRRQRLDDHRSALERQRQQLEAQVDQHQVVAQVMTAIDAFCQRVRPGLAHATFAQRRQLVELLIDRVVVTDGDVEIHYVIPTAPASEHVRFSHLRTNYLSLLAQLAAEWGLGAHSHGAARAGTPACRPCAHPQCRDHRQPVGQDHGKRGPPETSGYDGGKKVKGRKRHLLVDTLGLVLRVLVHPADLPDQDGGQWLLAARDELSQAFPRLEHVWANSAYHDWFITWVRETLGWTVEVVKRPSRWRWMPADQEPPETPRGFQVLPRRWVVESTQPHYLQGALDVHGRAAHHWADRAA